MRCRLATRFLVDGRLEADYEIWSGCADDPILLGQSRQLALVRGLPREVAR